MIDEYGNFTSDFYNERETNFVDRNLKNVTLQIMKVENKNTYLEIVFEVGDCSDISQINKKLIDRFYLSNEAYWTVHNLAMACGFITYDESNNPHLSKDFIKCTQLANCTCICDVESECYNNKQYFKINKKSFKYPVNPIVQDSFDGITN